MLHQFAPVTEINNLISKKKIIKTKALHWIWNEKGVIFQMPPFKPLFNI